MNDKIKQIRSSEIQWYCDNCDSHLNYQDGFNTLEGIWKCKNCGKLNDVTTDNIVSDELTPLLHISFVHCPNCFAHMKRNGFNDWYCTDCGCIGNYDYSNNELINVKRKA